MCMALSKHCTRRASMLRKRTPHVDHYMFCRTLLHQLSHLLPLTGIWECVDLRSQDSRAPGQIIAFSWLPGALVCLEAQRNKDAHTGLEWRVACVLSASARALPRVEELSKGNLMLHPSVRSHRCRARGQYDLAQHKFWTEAYANNTCLVVVRHVVFDITSHLLQRLISRCVTMHLMVPPCSAKATSSASRSRDKRRHAGFDELPSKHVCTGASRCRAGQALLADVTKNGLVPTRQLRERGAGIHVVCRSATALAPPQPPPQPYVASVLPALAI
jgi:hypothetical protein